MLTKLKIERHVVLRVPSVLGVARIVAQTELLVIVLGLLGDTFASQERIQVLEPPVALPSYKVKLHWHELPCGPCQRVAPEHDGNAVSARIASKIPRPSRRVRSSFAQ